MVSEFVFATAQYESGDWDSAPLVAAKLPPELTPGFRGRLVIQYDAVLDHLGRDERGVPVTLRNDQLTVRVQGEF